MTQGDATAFSASAGSAKVVRHELKSYEVLDKSKISCQFMRADCSVAGQWLGSPKAKVGQDDTDDHYEADDINDGVHGFAFSACWAWLRGDSEYFMC